MGRTTSGVTGMRFREDDELLSMGVIPADSDEDELYVFTVTDEGYAKRTPVSEYRVQGRGGLGIKTMRLSDERGGLIGGMIVTEGDEVISIKHSGQIIRSAVTDVSVTSRDTMGVKFVNTGGKDPVVAITLSPESEDEEHAEETADAVDGSETGEEHVSEPDSEALDS